jgi:glycosyltransferase involved in cell wall biosynthesis
MTTPALSILIPARDEHYHEIDLLHHTVTNVLANTSDATELVIVLDGYSSQWPNTPLPIDPRITVIHHRKSIGQRAATNEAARVARGEYVMKLDAHCALDKDFDTKLLAEFQPDWTVVPRQYNLHVFDWKCKQCGERTYQSPKPPKCLKCGSQFHKQVIVWHPTDGTGKQRGVSRGGWKNVVTDFWRFDSNLDFQYWGALGKRSESQGDIADTMSLLGACWAMRRERYWELDGLDESFGSWGDMGTEISLKTWLSGGRLVTNKRTWFAHFFRVGGIGFPYAGGGRKEVAKARGKEIWLNDKWPKARYPLSWLVNKFAPVPDWPNKKPTAACLYYTCSTLADPLATASRNQLLRARNGHELGCVSRERCDFGDWNIVVNGERGPLTMHRQILAGLERLKADIVFFCEHDVLYHPSHFEFAPPRKDTFYYNTNVWRVRSPDGHAVKTTDCKQLSGLCCYRELAIEHYRKRVERIGREGFSRRNGYEPGTRHLPNGYDDSRAESWVSTYPNLDIRHDGTATGNHWTPESFRNQKFAAGWEETDDVIPGWSKLAGRLDEVLKEMADG